MGNTLDKAVRAQGGGVVKPHQVKAMILAAHRAFLVQSKAGLVDDGVGFDAWRRATIHDVIGPAAPDSFRAVTQRDYAAVVAYFLRLAGEESEEVRVNSEQVRNSKSIHSSLSPIRCDERRRALWALALVEGELGWAFGGREGAGRYADVLFARIHGADRASASARQIWAVIFTLKSRAKGRAQRPAPHDSGRAQRPAPHDSGRAQRPAPHDSGRARRPAPHDSGRAQRPATHESDERRAKTALGARGGEGVYLPSPEGSERFPAFSRGF